MLSRHLPDLALPVNAVAAEQLQRMITDRRIPHALVIEGSDPEKNSALARLLAQAWLCSCETPLSGECRVCQVFDGGGQHCDYEIVRSSSASGAIPIDEIRALKEKAIRLPTEADGMVFLLEKGDCMFSQAQNAFLKLFEEPPDGVLFLMTCQTRMKLLETIRSRAFILHVEWSEEQDSPQRQQQSELEAFAEKFASSLAAPADTDCLILTGRYCPDKQGKGGELRRELIELFGLLREIFRQALILSSGAGSIIESPSEAAKLLASKVSCERLQEMTAQLASLEQAAANNAALSLVATAACVRLRTAAGF